MNVFFALSAAMSGNPRTGASSCTCAHTLSWRWETHALAHCTIQMCRVGSNRLRQYSGSTHSRGPNRMASVEWMAWNIPSLLAFPRGKVCHVQVHVHDLYVCISRWITVSCTFVRALPVIDMKCIVLRWYPDFRRKGQWFQHAQQRHSLQ